MRFRPLPRLSILLLTCILFWKLNALRPIYPLSSVRVAGQITAIVAGPSGTVILGYQNAKGGRVEIRALPSGHIVNSLDCKAPVSALALSDDKRFLAIATSSLPLGGSPLAEGEVEIWKGVSNSSFGRKQSVLRRNKSNWHFEATSLAWQTGGTQSPRLAVGGMFYQFKADPQYHTWDWERYSGNAALWDVNQKKMVRECGERLWGQASVDLLAFDTRHARWLGMAAGRLRADIFSFPQSRVGTIDLPSLVEVEDLVSSRDGELFVVGGRNRDSSQPQGFCARGYSRQKRLSNIKFEGENLSTVALSNDQNLFAVNSNADNPASNWNQIVIFDRATGNRRDTLAKGGVPVWSSRGRFLVVAGWNELHFYDAQRL